MGYVGKYVLLQPDQFIDKATPTQRRLNNYRFTINHWTDTWNGLVAQPVNFTEMRELLGSTMHDLAVGLASTRLSDGSRDYPYYLDTPGLIGLDYDKRSPELAEFYSRVGAEVVDGFTGANYSSFLCTTAALPYVDDAFIVNGVDGWPSRSVRYAKREAVLANMSQPHATAEGCEHRNTLLRSMLAYGVMPASPQDRGLALDRQPHNGIRLQNERQVAVIPDDESGWKVRSGVRVTLPEWPIRAEKATPFRSG